ncbi:MAG: lantibiotic dehydratase family protein [Chryseobacterium sp.]|uniref:lantibiotic dehydratase family protein n=1 Tax=Chryseobacterium sp. TaxID=1871047 RepID=UPI003D0BB1E6
MKEEVSDEELKEIYHHPVFQEAIYLASPHLFEELKKWINSEKELSFKEHQKLKHTFLKYYSRMSTRSTPFGLFAGVNLGKFRDDASILADNTTIIHQIRDTKLDMHFLIGLSDHFVKTSEIREQLLFFPNNSIYKIGNKIRYIEYQYSEGKREHIISSAQISDELQNILDFSRQGKTIHQITEILINSEITIEDAVEFVEELINNQILVSELEPNVSGKDFLDTIITVLSRIGINQEAEALTLIKNKLDALDQKINNPIQEYTKIEELIKSFEIEYDQKYLFQTDLYFKNKFALAFHWKKKLKQGIGFLNKITLREKENEFSKFKKAYYERFESQEMPLLYVLDAEVGIGYKQNILTKGIHPYLDDLRILNSKKHQNLHIEFNSVHKILNEKLQNALLEGLYTIELLDEDFRDYKENWNDLPDTLSFLAEIITDSDQEKLCLNTSTGSSAANLLGRFCSEKAEVQNLIKTIAKKEEEINPEFILAEIIHLPEARIGNIVRRPTLRQYEIPYLAQSLLPSENQIQVEDLYISLKNDRIVLRSKKLNKEIRPHLTNAHNYYTNALPVYHFLSDLYSQNTKSGLCFSWEGLEHIYIFLPRVEYNNIILSKARWKITEKAISSLESLVLDKKNFLLKIRDWRYKRKIPAWIQWTKFDNTLTINLENYDMAKLFIQTIKSEETIIIEEFLSNENDDFKHEFAFPMYKDKTL